MSNEVFCKQCTKQLEPKIPHYIKYKETIKKYLQREDVKQKLYQQRKEMREKDPEKTKLKDAELYAKRREERISCECGRQVMKLNLKNHLLTKYHMNHSNKALNPQNTETPQE